MNSGIVTPSRYLAVVNMLSSVLAFAQGIVTARLLGAEAYGVIAVIAAINATALNFLDIRLTDLAGKLYYRTGQGVDMRLYRASVVQVCLAGNGMISLCLSILGLAASLALIGLFTDTPVPVSWLVAQSFVSALVNWANTFDYLQRFSGRFYLIGSWRLFNRATYVAVFLSVLVGMPTLDGYYSAALMATVLGFVLTAGLSVFIWLRYDRLPLLRKGIFFARHDYWRDRQFLFFGNLLGYVKMLHRSLDVLVVGFFADDRITGLYRLARSLTDSFYVLFDAANQVYLPHFMHLLSQRAHAEYRRLAQRVFVASLGLTLLALVAEAVAMPVLMNTLLNDRFVGSEKAIVIMTIPFAFVTGVYMWLWPIYVYSGRIARYAAYSFAAALMQYAAMISLFLARPPTPEAAASGYLAYYVVLIPLAYRLLARGDWAECIPGVRPLKAPA